MTRAVLIGERQDDGRFVIVSRTDGAVLGGAGGLAAGTDPSSTMPPVPAAICASSGYRDFPIEQYPDFRSAIVHGRRGDRSR